MYRQLRLLRLALIAALLAMMAAALVPPVMQMLNPVALKLTAGDSQNAMPGCTDPGMLQMHHNQASGSGEAQSCPLCSLFCHVPALGGLPPLALFAPLNHWLALLPLVTPTRTIPAFTTPPARAPPANLV